MMRLSARPSERQATVAIGPYVSRGLTQNNDFVRRAVTPVAVSVPDVVVTASASSEAPHYENYKNG